MLAVLFFVCISGGGKQIAKITEKLVPIMGVLYIAVALFVIITHLNLLPGVFAQIFAFAPARALLLQQLRADPNRMQAGVIAFCVRCRLAGALTLLCKLKNRVLGGNAHA